MSPEEQNALWASPATKGDVARLVVAVRHTMVDMTAAVVALIGEDHARALDRLEASLNNQARIESIMNEILPGSGGEG